MARAFSDRPGPSAAIGHAIRCSTTRDQTIQGHLAYKGRTGGVGLDQADLERPTRAVIGNSPKGALLGLLAARIAGVKTRIYWIRGAKWDGRDDALGTVLRAMDRGTCRLSTARLAVSQSMVDAYMRQGIASDLTLLGRGGSRGVDAERFARSRSEKLHDPPRLAYIGRLAHGKGIRYLPFVLDEVIHRYGEIHLDIYGPMDLDDPVDADTMRALASHARVTIHGPTMDVAGALSVADLLVFPSTREGLPNAVLEAQAAGVPVFAWDVSGVRDAVDPGRSGNLYHLGDYAAMADGIVELLRAPERYTAMSLNSSAFVAQHFDAPLVQNQIFEWIDLQVAAGDSLPKTGVLRHLWSNGR